jgi:hypothetical protein
MGLFSALGSIFGGGSQKKASQKATDAMVAAYDRGIDTQTKFQQQVRQDYQPYTEAGTAALGKLSDLSGLGDPAAYQAALDGLKTDPLYTSLYGNGQEALLQNAAATGGLRGGNFARSSMDFGSDVLTNVYRQALSNYGNIANLGVGAQGTVTQTGVNAANNVTNLQGEIGGAQANNFLAKGRINAQNWSTVGSFLDDAVTSFLPGGNYLSAAKSMLGQPTSGSTSRLNSASQSVIASNPSIF